MATLVDEVEARVTARHDEDNCRQRHLAFLQDERFDVAGKMAAAAAAFAKATPTSSDPTRPGPWVTAIASMPRQVVFASSSARSTTPQISRICWREASSGTTPPHSR
jgi:hypothetical protein